MKPIAVINVRMLSDLELDAPSKLHAAGYEVIFVNDGPSVLIHHPPQPARERIATALLAGIFSRQERIEVRLAAEAALLGADELIKQLKV